MSFWILLASAALFWILTALPLSRRTEWWVRGADFPRLQFAIFGMGVLAAICLWPGVEGPWGWLLAAPTLLGVLYQAWWIAPYTRFFRREVRPASGAPDADRIRILSANVLMTNRSAADFVRVVRDARPDVFVTLETNAWWEAELRTLAEDYPHRLSCPLENLYGMHLHSRFPLEDPKVQFLVERDVPSMHTLLVLPSGRRVVLHCLHPAPPSPTENERSSERDAELVMVGRSVARARFPVIVSGDLNDVAWSATTRLFRKLSGLLDPRIGRGMFNTFHAAWPLCRWPVDHFFHSPHFTLVRLERLPACGSDHFPVLIELEFSNLAPPEQKGPRPDADDEATAREKLAEEAVTSTEVHRPGEGRPGGS